MQGGCEQYEEPDVLIITWWSLLCPLLGDAQAIYGGDGRRDYPDAKP